MSVWLQEPAGEATLKHILSAEPEAFPHSVLLKTWMVERTMEVSEKGLAIAQSFIEIPL